MQQVVAITVKELREAVRDRRSLFSGLFYGVWGPLVMALALTALARDRSDDTPLTLTVRGADKASSLMAFLDERLVSVETCGGGSVEQPTDGAGRPRRPACEGQSSDLPGLIRSRQAPVALEIGHDYPHDFNEARPAAVALLYDSSWTTSRNRADRVRALLADYARRVQDTRLILRGVAPAAVMPLDIAERDMSTAAGRAGAALATLPIFVLLAAFVGGMSVAADVTAGERERGSLESLLTNPVSPSSLVLGKWVATALVALATVTTTLAVSHLVLKHPRIQMIDLPVGLSVADAAHMWLLLAPLALLAAAVQLLIALQARTYKEAQTQLSLMMFLPMIPGFMFAFGSLQPAAWMARVPMLGQHLLITGLVRGEAPGVWAAGAVSALTLAAAAAALWSAAAVLTQERTVRRAAA
jgi:sodium transport system permease protein